MSVTAPDAPAAAVTPATPVRRNWKMAITPVVLVLIVVALLGYVKSQKLDYIEKNNLALSYILSKTWQHVELTLAGTILVLIIALPLGVALTRKGARYASPVVLALANIGQAAPAVGIIVLFAVAWQIGFWTAVVALTVYGILPSLRNTMVGLQQVDPALIDAGRGIGMSSGGVLAKVELPLAVPVILGGVRTTLVLMVGNAAIATFINGGGLGDIVVAGINNQRPLVLIVGSGMIAVLALLIDWLGGVINQVFSPRGL